MDRLLLVGNPNAGKTTVFNALTGRREKVANYSGVTVGAAFGKLKDGREVVDLPGAYSLSPYSEEEKITALEVEKGGVIINVVEALRLERSLILTRRLASLGRPMLVAVTMERELERAGGKIDINALSKEIGIECVFAENLDSRVKKGAFSRPTGWGEVQSAFTPPTKGEGKIAKFLSRDGAVIPLFFVFAAASFYLTFGRFGIGTPLSNLLVHLLSGVIAPRVESAFTAGSFVARLVSEGVIEGLAGVIGFMPRLAVMYLCLIILEESGFLPRAAFAFDGVLKKAGLSGKAVFPLLVGFGCTATANIAARSSDSVSVKNRVSLALLFIPCSARMPVFSFILAALFPGREFVAVVTVYAVGIILAIAAARVSLKITGEDAEPFVMELPSLRMPSGKIVASELGRYMRGFAVKAGTVLFAVSVAVWLLRSFSVDLQFLSEAEMQRSILAFLGGKIQFLFRPMGISGWQVPVAAICGLVAKESVVTALTLAYPLGIAGEISPESAIALTVFFAYYTPCVMALCSLAGESGGRICAFYGVFSFIAGLILGYAAHALALAVQKPYIIETLIAAAILLCAADVFIKLIRRKINGKNSCPHAGAACQAYGCGGCALQRSDEAFARQGSEGKRQTSKRRHNLRKRRLN